MRYAKFLGLMGDGVTNDAPRLQQIVDTLQGDLRFENGTYILNSVVVPNSNQHWIFEQGAILQWNAASFANCLSHSDGVSRFRTLSNLRFSNAHFFNSGLTGTAFGVNLGDSTHVPSAIAIDSCEADHCSLNVSGGQNHLIAGCYVHDTHSDRAIGCTTSAVGTNFDNLGSLVVNNRIVNCDNIGVYGGAMLRGLVAGNVIQSAGILGTAYAIDMNAARDSCVEGNIIIASQNGILFEQDYGTGGIISILKNTLLGTANNNGTGILVWQNTGTGTWNSISIDGNHVSTYNLGISVQAQANAVAMNNRVQNTTTALTSTPAITAHNNMLNGVWTA